MAQPAASSSKHIEFLDQIRGIAILSVFLVHTFGQSFGAPTLPWAGWHAGFNVPKLFLLICSYSMYLIHWPFLSLAPKLAGALSGTGRATPLEIFFTGLGFLLPIFLLSAIWYRVFEIPSIALGKNLIRRYKTGKKNLAMPLEQMSLKPSVSQTHEPSS